jgi:hypothetical protein
MRKRRWFQIHLSTAVLMMITVGLALLVNLRPTKRYADAIDFVLAFPNYPFAPLSPEDARVGRQYIQIETFGFPWDCWTRGSRVSIHDGIWMPEPESSVKQLLNDINELDRARNPNSGHGFDKGDIFVWSMPTSNWKMSMSGDFLVSFAAIVSAVSFAESILRRREARKT